MFKLNSQTILLTSFCLLGLFRVAKAQSLAPASILTAGQIASNGNITLNYAVAEIMVLNARDNNGNQLLSGFTGSTATSGIVTFNALPEGRNDKLVVTPNPATGLVNVILEGVNADKFRVRVCDNRGRIIYSAQYSGITKKMDLNVSSFAPGIYLLQVTGENNDFIGSCRIVKQ